MRPAKPANPATSPHQIAPHPTSPAVSQTTVQQGRAGMAVVGADESLNNTHCENDHGAGEGSSKPKKRKQKRQPSPNAYEKIPKPKK
jgi:protein phosphatase 1 regulatory subunit 11